MAPAPLRYLLIEDGHPTGPHSLAVLLQKAQVHVITADTLAAPENKPPQWQPIRTLAPLHEVLFPAKAKLTLGARTVEVVNTTAQAAAPGVDEILQANIVRQRTAEGELLKPHPPRSNKRRNDYLILAGGLNGIVAVRLLQGCPIYEPFLVGLFVMGNISLVWVMFFVMDRY